MIMDSLLQALSVYIAAALAPLSQPVDIVFAGDAMQHSAQIEAARTPGGEYDYSECFEALTPYISAADYAVVNLETPLGGKPYSGYPCFCSPDSYAEALKNAGFDMFLTANNHTLDRRDKGLRRTVMMLDSLGVDHIGTYRDSAERVGRIPLVKDIKGYKVGFLNYTYGTNGIKPGPDVVVDYIDTMAMKRDITATRGAGAELVVVAIHWGDEYRLLPNAAQKRVGKFLLDNGVDVVMGGHPHVIQPMELRVSSEGDALRRQLLVYSLGNFISNMKTRDTRGGVMVRLSLKRALDGRAYIDGARYLPVFTIPAGGGHNFRLVNAMETLGSSPWEYHRCQFLKSACGIFDKHNINVSVDSL